MAEDQQETLEEKVETIKPVSYCASTYSGLSVPIERIKRLDDCTVHGANFLRFWAFPVYWPLEQFMQRWADRILGEESQIDTSDLIHHSCKTCSQVRLSTAASMDPRFKRMYDVLHKIVLHFEKRGYF